MDAVYSSGFRFVIDIFSLHHMLFSTVTIFRLCSICAIHLCFLGTLHARVFFFKYLPPLLVAN